MQSQRLNHACPPDQGQFRKYMLPWSFAGAASSSSLSALTLAALLGFAGIGGAQAAPAMCDTNCVRRCQACTEVCAFGRCTEICSPPEPVCLGLCHTAKSTACAVQALHKNAPFHGNYCGYGNKSRRYRKKPVDELDAACMRHDKCYDKLYPFACPCDKALALEAKSIMENPATDNAVREKAALVATFYSQPIVPNCL